MAATTVVEQDVLEDTSHEITAQLVDSAGADLPLSSLNTITLSLFIPKTNTFINSRQDQDVKNLKDVTINSTGLVTWRVQPADTAIINATTGNNREVHRALFEFEDNAGNRGKKIIDLIVYNVATVP